MKEPTKKQQETLREFLHEAVVPLIEDVLVKKLGQAMSYAKEQFAPPSKPWVGLTDIEVGKYSDRLNGGDIAREVEAKLKERNT